MDGLRYQFVNEAFDQRDLVFAHKLSKYFGERYNDVNRRSARVGGLQWGLNSSTRWIIEFIVVLVIFFVVLWGEVPLPSIQELSVAGGIIIRLLPLSSKLLANFQKLDYSGPVLDELSQQILAPERARDGSLSKFVEPGSVAKMSFHDVHVKVGNARGTYFNKLINITLERGKIYAVVGTNGVGKSTFAKIILGSVHATEAGGLISLEADNSQVQSVAVPHLSDVVLNAFVPQEPLFIDASVEENLTHKKSYDAHRLDRLINAVGLEDYLSSLPSGLGTQIGDKFGYFSGGQRQRLALVRALLLKSDMLILDEPSSAADVGFSQSIIPILREHASDRITLIISHSKALIEMCDSVIEVSDKSVTNR